MTCRGSVPAGPSTLICVFAKPAYPGMVKTRLAARYGQRWAADLARAFFVDTWRATSSLTWARSVVATTDVDAAQWQAAGVGAGMVWPQGGGDLGCRLERVLERALGEADQAIAIGADTPGIPPQLLWRAGRALTATDAVLGPSSDGGFYLVGLKRCPTGLFVGLPWSDRTTLWATHGRLLQLGMKVRLLEPWFDVDRSDDLDRLRQLLGTGAISAPATELLLAQDPCP